MLLRHAGSATDSTPSDAKGMSAQQTTHRSTQDGNLKPVTPREVTLHAGGPPSASSTKKTKQSFDYVLKTGIAGGLAGCAVSGDFPPPSLFLYCCDP